MMISFNFLYRLGTRTSKSRNGEFLLNVSEHSDFTIYYSPYSHVRTYARIRSRALFKLVCRRKIMAKSFRGRHKRAVFINALQFEGDRILPQIDSWIIIAFRLRFYFCANIILFQIQKRCNAVAMLLILCVPGFHSHLCPSMCFERQRENILNV